MEYLQLLLQTKKYHAFPEIARYGGGFAVLEDRVGGATGGDEVKSNCRNVAASSFDLE